MKRRGFLASLLGALGFAAFSQKPKPKTMQDYVNDNPALKKQIAENSLQSNNACLALYMRHMSGESIEEIAKADGYPEMSVRSSVAWGEYQFWQIWKPVKGQLEHRNIA